MRLGTVTLQVADLERSLAFYEGLLGLTTLMREASTVQLGAQDGMPLVKLVEHPGVNSVPRRGHLGLYHVALRVPSRGALGQFLGHIGASSLRIGMADHLFSEALYLTDPDGLGLEVYADRSRESWTWEEGRLVGAALPLDVESLLAAAEDVPFAGIPAGSVIGHIHFYVDDLDRASGFYEGGLGFERMTTMPGARFVSAGGYHHHVAYNTWALGASLPEEDDARLLEWQLVLPDETALEAAGERLEAAGGVLERLPDGSVWATDPWRTVVRLRTP